VSLVLLFIIENAQKYFDQILLLLNLMITLNNISKEFNGGILFENVSFAINPKDRIGLAGKNGSGKTTLIKIICGEIVADKGDVVVPDGITLGYLPQEKNVSSQKKVIDECMQAFSAWQKQNERLNKVSEEIQNRNDYESKAYHELLTELNQLNEQILMIEPEKMRGRAEKVLSGLGFRSGDLLRPVSEFSQGWKMRIELAKLLLISPSLLLLDEPTNHLDIESIRWLERFLDNYQGAVLMVSHDRAMLDNITKRTIELNNGKAYDYKVSYSHYLVLRDERIKIQQSTFNNQQKQIQEIEQFVERFRYKASKSKQVQSRVKMLDKMERVEIDELDNSAIRFSFPFAQPSGKVVVEGKSVSKYFGRKNILNKIDFQILRGETLAFIGRNGEGKTTLAKIIAQLLEFSGELKLGHNVVWGYFAQDQGEELDHEKTVFETLDDVAVGEIRTRLKAILGAFLFQGDDIDKKVKVLSGGEKSRLALAQLLLRPTNLLILDEPTNHLDILSKDILKTALLQYTGTIIIVSHDRDFLQGLASRLFEFSNMKIKEHLGGIEEYLEKHKIENFNELEKKIVETVERTDKVNENKLKWEKKKENDKQVRKLKNSIEELENKIHELEMNLELVNEKLSKPEHYQK
jgi:ATP-binding cassette subfamily F protein 3